MRFTPKFAGDTSAEEWAEAHLRALAAAASASPRRQRLAPFDKVRFAHQIDFATSGVLLAATTRAAAAAAAACFKARTAAKRYICIVFGHPSLDSWTSNEPLCYDERDPKGFRMRVARDAPAHAVDAPSSGVKSAATRFRVLCRGVCSLPGPWAGADVAALEAAPASGRRHQIRVHAAAAGHPLMGDCAYSPDADSFRMFLHAHELVLPLQGADADGAPEREEPLRIMAPLPRAFAAAMTPPLDVEAGEDGGAHGSTRDR